MLLSLLLVATALPRAASPDEGSAERSDPESASACAAAAAAPLDITPAVILPGSRKPLHAPFETPDPFLMAVYHKDAYPAGDGLMQAPRRGNGADFSGQGGYSMYHGDRVPGFPQHPHRGFETITATLQGYIDHTDSHVVDNTLNFYALHANI